MFRKRFRENKGLQQEIKHKVQPLRAKELETITRNPRK
jgi:hypothetical protein